MRVAILPSLGIGDALLMMIAAHHLHRLGHHVTLIHPQFSELASWFPFCSFLASSREHCELDSFEFIIAENDNAPIIKHWATTFRDHLSIFYPTYSLKKHGSLTSSDRAFNPQLPMAINIGRSIETLFPSGSISYDNGITPPSSLTARKHPRRVLIHPTSREPAKNWLPSQFLKLASQLNKRGFDPHFCVTPAERSEWLVDFPAPELPTLADFAAYVYESYALIGNDSLAGHLASNLNLPTLTIANDPERMRLWRPGWKKGVLVLPPQWLPWKPNRWQRTIPVRTVLRAFDKKLLSL